MVKSFKLPFGLLTVIAYCLPIFVRMPLFYAGHLFLTDFSNMPNTHRTSSPTMLNIFYLDHPNSMSLNTHISNENIFISCISREPFRPDKPENPRNGGVCLYYNENLPIKRRPDLEILNETIVAEIKLYRKNIFLVSLYRHHNQSAEEFTIVFNTKSQWPLLLLGVLMQGPPCFGKIIVKLGRGVFLITL